jgi:hypothetical protein
MVFLMGRHELARNRSRLPTFVAAVVFPAAALFAVAGDVHPLAGKADEVAEPVTEDAAPCCLKITAAPPAPVSAPLAEPPQMSPVSGAWLAASRWRLVPRFLPTGVASERGLQVRTILAARSISAEFPQIHNIGGVRPDALRWHPNGLALDVMIPNPSSAEGIALGNAILDFALRNADRFGLQDAIWRGVYYTPTGPHGSGNGHFDHVHVTTTGGGYPTGSEVYPR